MKILIADDEYYTVQLVNSQLDWNLLGIHQVLMCYNGAEAMEIFDAERPEIVLCDIDMPKYDGMAVLRHVMETAPRTRFIFLTCFEKFDYVRNAIHLGAFDYLTKPFSEPEVYASIMKAIQEVKERDRIESGKKDLERVFLENLLSGAISPTREAVERAAARSSFCHDPSMKWHLVLSGITRKGSSSSEDSLYRFVFTNMLTEVFFGSLEERCTVDLSFDGIEAVLLPVPESARIDFIARASELGEVVRHNLRTAYACCISEPRNLWEFSGTLEHMKEGIRRQFLNGVPVRLDTGWTECGEADRPLDQARVREYLNRQDTEGLTGYLRNLLDDLQQRVLLSEDLIRRINTDLTQEIYSFCSEHEITASDLYNDAEVRSLQSRVEQMPFYLIRCTEVLCRRITQLCSLQQDESAIVGQIAEYVSAHYREPIGRDEIASSLAYSKNYLSLIFRQQIGMSVRDYINRYRIEEAKRLLSGTDEPVGDIAMDVGFESMTYFSTVFKKSTGVSPSAYRRTQP